jgi:Co/Zn/Cd efflux system component
MLDLEVTLSFLILSMNTPPATAQLKADQTPAAAHDACCTTDIHHDHGLSDMAQSPRYRKVLWAALLVNALMFLIEMGAGFNTGSVSLLADAVDFFSDAANYAITLYVLSMGLLWRAKATLFKGCTMFAIGILVLGKALWALQSGQPPEAITMGAIGLLALVANVAVAAMLYAYREGDANMQSVWLCSRNDAIGNLAIVIAAMGVFGSGTAWPDLMVAFVMASLGIAAGWKIIRLAGLEVRTAQGVAMPGKDSHIDHAHNGTH